MGTRINAIGMINCLGQTPDEIFLRLLTGDQNTFSLDANLLPEREILVGAVKHDLEKLPQKYATEVRTAQLAIHAYHQIEEEVQQQVKKYGQERIGLVLGTSTSGITVGEAAFRAKLSKGSFPKEYSYALQEPGAVSSILADLLKIKGPAYTISTACSSGARALLAGRNLLDAGVCDAVICGGADALCRLSVNGFSSLELLSKTICSPFSQNRSGITIGEGACLMLLTRDEDGILLLGTGESSDAYHFSAPDPAGQAVEAAIRAALLQAQLSAEQISYINLHGTGTQQNDTMEAKVINRVFGAKLPCSSTKPLIGHTLGAAGAIEAGFCYMLLDRATDFFTLPPHRYDGIYDQSLPDINLISDKHEVKAKGQIAMLSNSFAFGGNNCVIVIGKDFG